MPTIRVHTTQNVTLEYEAASIGNRVVAALIDLLILVAWGVAWSVLISQLASHSGAPVASSSSSEIVGIVILFIIASPAIFYSVACEAFLNGQSLGKKARDLRVVRLDGTAPRFGDFVLRWLLRLVDVWLFYGLIGIITMAINGKGQRLGDLAAGTTVISLKPLPNPLRDLTGPPLPSSYQPVFPQAADLSDHDVALLRQLLSRSLQQDNYLLLHETANKIKQLLQVQSDLGDEAFLRSILRDHAHIVLQQG